MLRGQVRGAGAGKSGPGCLKDDVGKALAGSES